VSDGAHPFADTASAARSTQARDLDMDGSQGNPARWLNAGPVNATAALAAAMTFFIRFTGGDSVS